MAADILEHRFADDVCRGIGTGDVEEAGFETHTGGQRQALTEGGLDLDLAAASTHLRGVAADQSDRERQGTS